MEKLLEEIGVDVETAELLELEDITTIDDLALLSKEELQEFFPDRADRIKVFRRIMKHKKSGGSKATTASKNKEASSDDESESKKSKKVASQKTSELDEDDDHHAESHIKKSEADDEEGIESNNRSEKSPIKKAVKKNRFDESSSSESSESIQDVKRQTNSRATEGRLRKNISSGKKSSESARENSETAGEVTKSEIDFESMMEEIGSGEKSFRFESRRHGGVRYPKSFPAKNLIRFLIKEYKVSKEKALKIGSQLLEEDYIIPLGEHTEFLGEFELFLFKIHQDSALKPQSKKTSNVYGGISEQEASKSASKPGNIRDSESQGASIGDTDKKKDKKEKKHKLWFGKKFGRSSIFNKNDSNRRASLSSRTANAVGGEATPEPEKEKKSKRKSTKTGSEKDNRRKQLERKKEREQQNDPAYKKLCSLVDDILSSKPKFRLTSRRYNSVRHPKCFAGNDFIKWMVKNKKYSTVDALTTGQNLFDNELLFHVGDEKPFSDSSDLFEFAIHRFEDSSKKKEHKKQNSLAAKKISNTDQDIFNILIKTNERRRRPKKVNRIAKRTFAKTSRKKTTDEDDIENVLKMIGLTKYLRKIKQENVDIETFATLSQDEIRELGITSVDLRKVVDWQKNRPDLKVSESKEKRTENRDTAVKKKTESSSKKPSTSEKDEDTTDNDEDDLLDIMMNPGSSRLKKKKNTELAKDKPKPKVDEIDSKTTKSVPETIDKVEEKVDEGSESDYSSSSYYSDEEYTDSSEYTSSSGDENSGSYDEDYTSASDYTDTSGSYSSSEESGSYEDSSSYEESDDGQTVNKKQSKVDANLPKTFRCQNCFKHFDRSLMFEFRNCEYDEECYNKQLKNMAEGTYTEELYSTADKIDSDDSEEEKDTSLKGATKKERILARMKNRGLLVDPTSLNAIQKKQREIKKKSDDSDSD